MSVFHLQDGHRKGIYLKAAWNLFRLDDPVSSRILHPFASWCASKSITDISAPQFLECIDYVNIQTVPPEIPTWCSGIRTNHITHQRAGKGKRMLGEEARKDTATFGHQHKCSVWSLQLQLSWPEKILLNLCTFSFLHQMRKFYGPPLSLWREKNLHKRRGKDRTHNAKVECAASQLPHAGTFLFLNVSIRHYYPG